MKTIGVILISEDIDWNDVQAKNGQNKPVKLNPQHVLDLLEELRVKEKEYGDLNDELNKMKEDFDLQSSQLEKLGAQLKQPTRSDQDKVKISELTAKVSRLESDNIAKQQLITQLEKDVRLAKDELELATKKLKESDIDGLHEKISSLESSLESKESELSALRSKFDALEAKTADSGGMDALEADKAAFELEKKRLFAEMENFEVGLRMEMEEKDEKIATLEAQLKSSTPSISSPALVAKSPSFTSTAGAGSKSDVSENRRQRMIEKLGLADIKPAPVERTEVLEEGSSLPLFPMTGDRIICPKCNNTSIKVENDRDRVLTYMGGVPFYAKKYSCKKCQFDFRID
ncbi:MAG: hypothetical protein ACTSUE_06025 [Promethearchaeota archaeon]